MFEPSFETSAFFITVLFFFRVIIIFRYQTNAVDEFSYLLLLREFRKKIPIDLGDKFVLEDDKSFYPIGYIFYLYIFKRMLSYKTGKIIVILIPDVIEFAAAALFLNLMSVEFDLSLLFALIVFSPAKLAYNNQLASRGLGDLFFFLFCLAFVLANSDQHLFLSYFLMSVGTVGVILTHKMTLQLLIFAVVPTLFIFLEIHAEFFLISVITSIALSYMVLGKAFSVGQALAHFDIVSFWYRNWPFLGKDQFHLFRPHTVQLKTEYHANNVRSVIEKIIRSVGHNPIAAVIVVYSILIGEWNTFAIIVMSIWAMVLATLFIDPLKCLGAGHLYVQNTVGASAIFFVIELQSSKDSFTWLLVLGLLGFLASSGIVVFKLLKVDDKKQKNQALEKIAECLESLELGTVLVVPFGLSNLVGLRTKHRIFFGGHTSGFRKLEPYWPIWRTLPIADKNFSVDYIVSERSEEEVINVMLQGFKTEILIQNDYWIVRRVRRMVA